jgi:Putative zinc-finger
MTHPEELLAGYVDGTLGTDERAVVDAHLPSCATCREEVDRARTAVTALTSLEELPVPFGVTGPVLAEAGRRFERRRSTIWSRVQWAAAAAAAAALVLVVAVNVDLGGGDDAGERAGAAAATGAGGGDGAGEESAPTSAFAGLEKQTNVNYDDAGVQGLAVETAQERSALPTDEGGTTTGETGAVGESAAALDASFVGPGAAIACLRQAEAPVNDPRDSLVRLIEAKYEGRPAYLAVFLESPGAGQSADKVVVWVVAKGGCQILHAAQQAL